MDQETEAFLEHFGIKGMHWGIRNDTHNGVSRQVDKHAKKDAQEFARAKAYYGDGAGTRRKLINATVKGKSANMPGYKAAFDHHLAKQDPAYHAQKAVSERNSTDRKLKTKQRAGFFARKFTGEMGTQAAFAATILAGGVYLNSANGRKHLNTLMTKVKAKKTTYDIGRFLAKNGVK